MKKKWLLVIVLLIIIGAGAWYYSSNSYDMSQLPTLTLNKPTFIDHVKGNENASIVFIEYSDFQCPACASYQPILQQFDEQYGSQVAFVYRHFPLKQIHPYATIAAQASEAAAKQGKFWEYHDMLFERQSEWVNKDAKRYLLSYAEELGLDVALFTSDMNSPETKAILQREIDSAGKLGLQGTPSFFLNGKPVRVTSYEQLASEVDALISP